MAGLLDAVIRSAARPAVKPGIRVYHSSPHDFDRFDYSKIGQGQGAQSYGHGLYFAESPKVSGQGGEYWNEFLRKFHPEEVERQAADLLKAHDFNRAKAAGAADEELAWRAYNAKHASTPFAAFEQQGFMKNLEHARDMLLSDKPVGPRTYEVNINARPDQFLDWDKPVSQQSAGVADRLADIAADRKWRMGDVTGARFYEEITPLLTPNKHYDLTGAGRERASGVLRDAGIPGIRYLDQGSRNAARHLKMSRNPQDLVAPPSTYNYVVNNDALLDIMKKYSIPGMMGLSGAGYGAQSFAPYFPQQGSQ